MLGRRPFGQKRLVEVGQMPSDDFAGVVANRQGLPLGLGVSVQPGVDHTSSAQLGFAFANVARGEAMEHRAALRQVAGVVLPDRLEIIAAETSLRLQLKRRRSLDSGTGKLGRGRPPDGMELRDLTELDLGGMPELDDEDG